MSDMPTDSLLNFLFWHSFQFSWKKFAYTRKKGKQKLSSVVFTAITNIKDFIGNHIFTLTGLSVSLNFYEFKRVNLFSLLCDNSIPSFFFFLVFLFQKSMNSLLNHATTPIPSSINFIIAYNVHWSGTRCILIFLFSGLER